MSAQKNVSGNYTITLAQGNGVMTINGDLDVLGNITYVDQLNVNDPFITVAGNNTGTVTSMGMVAQKTATTFAGLRFNTLLQQWEISPLVDADGGAISPYLPISSGGAGTVAGADTQIQFNQADEFGASANLSFDYVNHRLTLQGHQVLGNIGATPDYTGNGTAVYGNTVGPGGTGVYVKNAQVDDELVSRRRALMYGFIF
jgi:hypothetical protein